jgi:hypothetical protein
MKDKSAYPLILDLTTGERYLIGLQLVKLIQFVLLYLLDSFWPTLCSM